MKGENLSEQVLEVSQCIAEVHPQFRLNPYVLWCEISCQTRWFVRAEAHNKFVWIDATFAPFYTFAFYALWRGEDL